jgi:GrpB-like predicted nucleotidyltransferase (UPF0157 family)
VAADYAKIKREASDLFKTDSEGYVAHKHDFVEQAVNDAVRWLEQRNQTVARQEDY